MRTSSQKPDVDEVLYIALIGILVLVAILSAGILGDYTGHITSSHEAHHGTITEVRIDQIEPAFYWNGFYGIAIAASSVNLSWSSFATPAGMSQVALIFQCFEPGITHEVYSSTAAPQTINWGNVTAATLSDVDAWLGIDSSDYTSPSNTFTDTITIHLGGREIPNVPATYTNQVADDPLQAFNLGVLHDPVNDHFIFVTQTADTFLKGFNEQYLNYQMFVGVPNATSINYYFYTDPFDECPAGLEEARGLGNVEGVVTDNTTGLPLENAFVSLGLGYDITDENGTYNISTWAGDYNIIAMKDGFNNYVNNVSILEFLTTYHNISMHREEQEGTGIGPGIGPGVASGSGRGPGVDNGPGIGPGVGPGIGPYIERPEDIGIGHFITLDRLYKKLRIGNFFIERMRIYSFKKDPIRVNIRVEGNSSEVLEIDKTELIIQPDTYENVTITGFGRQLGTYTGEILVSGDFNDSLPVKINIVPEDKLPVEALIMQIEMMSSKPNPGDIVKFRLNLQNMLVDEHYNISLDYYLQGVEARTANRSMYLGNDTVELLTSTSIIKDFKIPNDWEHGDYYLIVEANYLDLFSKGSTIFTVYQPLHMYSIFGVMRLWQLLLGLLALALLILAIILIRKRMESKKRFHAKVEYKLLPQKGARSLYVGKIAETENDTYFDMDKLTVHSIVAGSTGGGKTIAAQGIVEEALLKNVGVIVVDPTAQWSGMLRKCTDSQMISLYPRFHYNKKSARAFNGNVMSITNPRQKIDFMKYWKPGEIQIFTASTLDPKEIDMFVANTVREIFHSNLKEFRGLRFMMVYDEVHRLLPKFGGSGEGFIQIERACREFRKWGIGVLLISQVLADFVGQIKANINTEVQMKTRDEGDLNRIETKYGKGFIQSLVKSPVGSGMVQNSSWNRGNPYFVTFRPILHSVKRLTDEELAQYNKYNEMIDELEYQIEQLEQEEIDVFDLKLELKLALDKVKGGSFNMVDIYLEGLKPRLEKHWKQLGKEPKKKEIELVAEEELLKDLEQAKNARKEYELQNEKKEEKAEEKGPLKFDEDVPPEKILKLSNGMLVINLKNLIDEIRAMKKEDFEKHVSPDKNEFADWIRNVIRDEKLAKIADKVITKEDFMGLLEAAEKGESKKYVIKNPKQVDQDSKEDSQPDESEKAEPTKDTAAGETQKETNEGSTDTQKNKSPSKVVAEEISPGLDKIGKADNIATEDKSKTKNVSSEEIAPDIVEPENPKTQPLEEKPNTDSEMEKIFFKETKSPFMLENGESIRSLAELENKLPNMDDGIFHNYVNPQKNDFANWIEGALEQKDIADSIRVVQDKQKIVKILKEKHNDR